MKGYLLAYFRPFSLSDSQIFFTNFQLNDIYKATNYNLSY